MPRAAGIAIVTLATLAIGAAGALGSSWMVRPGTHLAAAAVPVSPSPSPMPSPSALPSQTPTPSPTPTGIPMPTDAVLSAPSSQVVWAVVAGQYLFTSADRATSWQARTLPSAGAAGNPLVSFVDATTGFVMFRSESATGCGLAGVQLWSTADGGNTWQAAGPLPSADCTDAMYFTDARHGMISTGDTFNVAVIWRTQDGGNTWVKAQSDVKHPAPRVNSFQVYGSTVLAYAPPFVYRSSDGGLTWAYVTQSPNSSKSIAFVTASTWIELIPHQSFATTDGGQSWHAFNTDYDQAAPIPPLVVFASPAVGYATVRGQVQRTLDGGVHWEMVKNSWP